MPAPVTGAVTGRAIGKVSGEWGIRRSHKRGERGGRRKKKKEDSVVGFSVPCE